MSTGKLISNIETGNKRKKHDDITAKILSKTLKLDKSANFNNKNKREINLKEKKMVHRKNFKPMAKLKDEVPLENNVVNEPDEIEKALPDKADNEGNSSGMEESDNEGGNQITSEYYLDHGYAFQKSNNQSIYAKNENQEEQYFIDPITNFKRYANKKTIIDNKEQVIEYPILLKNGEVKYIYNDGNPLYLENLTTHEIIFPKDNDTGEEMYLEDYSGTPSYPRNSQNRQFYRKNTNEKEIAIDNIYAKDENTEIYPKESNKDEYYLRQENMEIGAYKMDNQGYSHQYYARKANGDEFYPRRYFNK